MTLAIEPRSGFPSQLFGLATALLTFAASACGDSASDGSDSPAAGTSGHGAGAGQAGAAASGGNPGGSGGSSTGGTGGVSSGGVGGSAGSAGQAGCKANPELEANRPWSCEQAEPCQSFALNPDGRFIRGTIEDARCVLGALKQRTPASYEFYLEAAMVGVISDEYTVHVLPDQTAVVTRNQARDIEFNVSTWHVNLQTPEYFDTCSLLNEGAELEQCLSNFWTDPASGCPTCPAP